MSYECGNCGRMVLYGKCSCVDNAQKINTDSVRKILSGCKTATEVTEKIATYGLDRILEDPANAGEFETIGNKDRVVIIDRAFVVDNHPATSDYLPLGQDFETDISGLYDMAPICAHVDNVELYPVRSCQQGVIINHGRVGVASGVVKLLDGYNIFKANEQLVNRCDSLGASLRMLNISLQRKSDILEECESELESREKELCEIKSKWWFRAISFFSKK